MLTTTVCTEPDVVSRYFDKREWSGEVRGHAEVAESFRPKYGWQIVTGRKKISQEWLLMAEAEGITRVTLRVRYPGSRVVTSVFPVAELLNP